MSDIPAKPALVERQIQILLNQRNANAGQAMDAYLSIEILKADLAEAQARITELEAQISGIQKPTEPVSS